MFWKDIKKMINKIKLAVQIIGEKILLFLFYRQQWIDIWSLFQE